MSKERMTIEEARDYLRQSEFTFDQEATDDDDDHGNEHWRRTAPKGFSFCDSVTIIQFDDGFAFSAHIHGLNDDLKRLFAE